MRLCRFSSFEQVILEKIGERKVKSEKQPEHNGKLLEDTTVCEQTIRYPTDISFLDDAREISENLIDDL